MFEGLKDANALSGADGIRFGQVVLEQACGPDAIVAGQEGSGVDGGPIGQHRPHLDQPVRVLGEDCVGDKTDQHVEVMRLPGVEAISDRGWAEECLLDELPGVLAGELGIVQVPNRPVDQERIFVKWPCLRPIMLAENRS
jgi:hypothetical protein